MALGFFSRTTDAFVFPPRAIDDVTLSPLLPSDEQLAEMSDIGYELFMNNWTTRSQLAEYLTVR